jgi:site-specific recombinase XerD
MYPVLSHTWVVLSIYRRHREACKYGDDRVSKKCRCALWAKGTLEGKPFQKSLKTRNFERAEQIKRTLEDGIQAKEQPKAVTVKSALASYVKESERRNLNATTLRKYKFLQSALDSHAEKARTPELRSWTTATVRSYLETRKIGPTAAGKEIERIRTFFNFCISNGWITINPAKPIRAPKKNIVPRIPFDEKQIQNILSKVRDDRELAFILVLRHTGLRIGDASMLRTTQFSDNRIFLRTTKAGVPVSVVIPPQLVSLLKAIETHGGYFFLWGESTNVHSVSNLWRKRIKAICKELKITPDHPHRFRHSLAADLLTKGASVEDVAAILGNSPAIVIKHYSQWIQSRQDRLDTIVAKTWAKPKLKLVGK